MAEKLMPGGLMQRTNVVACSTCGLSNLANISPWPRPTVFRMFGPYPQCNDDCPNGALDPSGEPHRTDCGSNCDSGMCLPRYGLPPPGLRIPDMYERCTEMSSNGNNGMTGDGPLGPRQYACMAPPEQGGTGTAAPGCVGGGALPIREIDMDGHYYLSSFGPGWDAKGGTGAIPTPAGRPGYAGAARIHFPPGVAPSRDEWVVNKGSMPKSHAQLDAEGQGREGFCNTNAQSPMTPIPHDFVPSPPDPPVRNAGSLPPAGPQSIGSRCSGQHVPMNTPEDTSRAAQWAGETRRQRPPRVRFADQQPGQLVQPSKARHGAVSVDALPSQAEWLQLQETGALAEQQKRLQTAEMALRQRQWQGFQYKDGPVAIPMEGPPQPCPPEDQSKPGSPYPPSHAGFRFVCTAPTQAPAGGAAGCRVGGCSNPPRGVCNSGDAPPQGTTQCSEMSQWSPYAFNRALSQCMRTCRFQPYPKGIGACTRACQRASYGTEYPFY